MTFSRPTRLNYEFHSQITMTPLDFGSAVVFWFRGVKVPVQVKYLSSKNWRWRRALVLLWLLHLSPVLLPPRPSMKGKDVKEGGVLFLSEFDKAKITHKHSNSISDAEKKSSVQFLLLLTNLS